MCGILHYLSAFMCGILHYLSAFISNYINKHIKVFYKAQLYVIKVINSDNVRVKLHYLTYLVGLVFYNKDLLIGLVFYNKGLLIGLVLYFRYKYIPKSKQVNKVLGKFHAKFIIFAYGTSICNTYTLCANDIYGNLPIPT